MSLSDSSLLCISSAALGLDFARPSIQGSLCIYLFKPQLVLAVNELVSYGKVTKKRSGQQKLRRMFAKAGIVRW